MKEENRQRVINAGRGWIPNDFRFSVGDGWTEILEVVARYASHHLGRWNEVMNIKENLLAKGVTIDGAYDWINEYFRENPVNPLETCKLEQVKEKFGGLRIYYSGSVPYIDGLISMAEFFASKTCEECGKPGKQSKHPDLMATVCEEHDAH